MARKKKKTGRRVVSKLGSRRTTGKRFTRKKAKKKKTYRYHKAAIEASKEIRAAAHQVDVLTDKVSDLHDTIDDAERCLANEATSQTNYNRNMKKVGLALDDLISETSRLQSDVAELYWALARTR